MIYFLKYDILLKRITENYCLKRGVLLKNLYILKFEKILVEKIWGGRALNDKLDITLESEKMYGESWEVAANKNGSSIIKNGHLAGKNLTEIAKLYKEKLLGKECYEKFGEIFPIMAKYLDINDKLSVQVHPEDEYALRVEGEFGKTEAWYIIDADENAKIILGLKKGTTKDEFIEKSKKGDFTFLETVKVKKGDLIFIKPGTVHATLEGSVLIYEIQQNSDTTYRIYDFDRLENGKKRELHIDKAVDVIDFESRVTPVNKFESYKKDSAIIEKIVSCNYFTTEKIKINGNYRDGYYDGFRIYSCFKGELKVRSSIDTEIIKSGESILIPAEREVDFIGEGEIFKSFV